jgi:PTS system mannitol-specific IIC component
MFSEQEGNYCIYYEEDQMAEKLNRTVGEESSTAKIQKFGRFLSGMVMPNIGAFIAWGIITALFIPTGWFPNENLSALVGPMIMNMLPLLIGYTGGKLVYGQRGGVIGAIGTMGIIVGADIPMFIGAMLMGPLGGYSIKKVDEVFEGKIKPGFEMLVNNFSAGIVGMLLALLAYLAIGPVVLAINGVLESAVNAVVSAGLLPLASVFIEPGKILFLNNAMNHGVLGPLGIQESKALGQSIFFLLETNPGPGLGILLAYWMFAKGMAKQSSPGAIIIHFFGGIHEIYFPYVLMNPILVLAVIAGGASGVFTFSLLGAGLVATPSPGSIFALMAMTPKGGFIPVIAGVAISTAVSFVVASFFIKKNPGDEKLEAAQSKVKTMKKQSKGKHENSEIRKSKSEVNKVIFACDAGMGSSAMGASSLKNKFKKAGLDIYVTNKAINEIPGDADIVVTHESLGERARKQAPDAEIVLIKNFVGSPAYDALVERLK